MVDPMSDLFVRRFAPGGETHMIVSSDESSSDEEVVSPSKRPKISESFMTLVTVKILNDRDPRNSVTAIARSVDRWTELERRMPQEAGTVVEGRNALFYVTAPLIATELVRYGADVNLRDSSGMTPLLHACKRNCWDLVECLLAHGADPDVMTGACETPLSLAARGNMIELVAQMLPLVTIKGNDQSILVDLNRLHYCWSAEKTTLVAQLIQKGVNVNFQTESGETALHDTVTHGVPEMVEVLLAHGANPNLRDFAGRTPITYVSSGRSPPAMIQMATLLCNAGARMDEVIEGRTLLHWAALHSYMGSTMVPFVDWLVAHGLCVNQPDDFGRTPLSMSIQTRHCEVSIYLIEHGAGVTDNIFHQCVGFGNVPLAELMLRQGIQANGGEGYTFLAQAVRTGNLAMVQCLMNSGAVAVPADLTYAVVNDHEGIVGFLLEKGIVPEQLPDASAMGTLTYDFDRGVSTLMHEKAMAVRARVGVVPLSFIQSSILDNTEFAAYPYPRQWMSALPVAGQAEMLAWARSCVGDSRTCMAAFYHGDDAVLLRRYTEYEGPVSELLAMYLVPQRSRSRLMVKQVADM